VTKSIAAMGPSPSVSRNQTQADLFRVRAWPPARIATVIHTSDRYMGVKSSFMSWKPLFGRWVRRTISERRHPPATLKLPFRVEKVASYCTVTYAASAVNEPERENVLVRPFTVEEGFDAYTRPTPPDPTKPYARMCSAALIFVTLEFPVAV
jgi:hypothetical protein